jgi:hypothetical protein
MPGREELESLAADGGQAATHHRRCEVLSRRRPCDRRAEAELSSARAFLLHGYTMVTTRSQAEALPEDREEGTAARNRELWLLYAGWFFVALGSTFRILAYVANPSLSIDESYLALNLVERSPSELIGALDFNQAAPVGFLEAEKLIIAIFGSDEYALRFLPLLLSLAAIVLFCGVAQRVLRPSAALVAVATFALLDPLVYYSATAKQYAFDVIAAVAILTLALVLEERPLRRRDFLALTLLGGVLVWFSHASVFVLGGLALLLGIRCVGDRDWRRTSALVAMVGVWAASFAVEYLLTRSNLAGIVGSFGADGGGELLTPGQPGASEFGRATDRLRYLVGLEDTASGEPILASLPSYVNRSLTVLILLVVAVGFISLLRQRPRLALFLATPAALAAIASAGDQYPLVGRTLLFLLPSVALCIGEGARVLLALIARKSLIATVAVAITASILAIAILPTIHVFEPRRTEEMKLALRYLGMHHRNDDALYVSNQGQYAFAYYHLCGCASFDPRAVWPFSIASDRRGQRAAAVEARSPDLIIEAGPSAGDEVRTVIKPLVGRSRVWVLFADTHDYEKEPLLDYLDMHGRRLQHFRAPGPSGVAASLYLYDLRGGAAPKP